MSDTTSSTPYSRPIPIAPAPNGRPTESQSAEQSLMPYTCLTCAKRKVRCDKTAPTCSTCKKARLECSYQEPAPRKRKRKPVDDVHERLEHYEKLLKKNGILSPDESTKTSPPQLQNPFYLSRTNELDLSGKLKGAPGKSYYVNSNVWRHLGDEFQASSEDEEGPEEQPVGTNLSSSTADPVSAALLSPNSPPASLVDLHPTYESAMKLWKIYVENVEPIVKVVHIPSGLVMLQRAAANPSSASRPTEALLFAIYHFALISISDADCQKIFVESRAKLLSRYHDALRQALVNSYFLRTTDLTVMQAFVLFLLSVRSIYDPHTFWILTGVAVRIAQRIGLHRDGEELGLKPFDVQMRRRVFWQLLPLDGLAGQLCGTGISIGTDSWNTKQPWNINDTDMWPDMEDPPKPRIGATDMMFCLARSEIAKFVQKANLPRAEWASVWDVGDVEEREQQLNELEEEFETKYLRYCDFANPVHHLTMAMLRSALSSGRLRIRLPRAKHIEKLPDDERTKIWTIANRILDYDIAAYDNNLLKPFMWHLQAFFQFDPLIWVLNELRSDPLTYQDEDTWPKIERIYENHPSLVEQRRSLHVAVGRLTLKSWDSYHSIVCRENEALIPEPSFITTLRTLTCKRESVHISDAASSKPEYNPFNPGDGSDDLNYTAPEPNPAEFDFSKMMDFTDSIDWLFWDQLVRDPTSFPTS